ncbi:17861_t:CDS:2, partial [Funneliformis geosporum]
ACPQQHSEKFQHICWKSCQNPQNNILPEAKIYYVKRHAKPPSNATEHSLQRVLTSV